MKVLALCLLLIACGHPPQPVPVGVTLRPYVRVSAAVRGDQPPPGDSVDRAIRAYRRAEKTVPKSILHRDVGPEEIHKIWDTRDAAHEAVQVLIDQRPHPTPEALKASKDATDAFIRAQNSEIFSSGKWPSAGPASK